MDGMAPLTANNSFVVVMNIKIYPGFTCCLTAHLGCLCERHSFKATQTHTDYYTSHIYHHPAGRAGFTAPIAHIWLWWMTSHLGY